MMHNCPHREQGECKQNQLPWLMKELKFSHISQDNFLYVYTLTNATVVVMLESLADDVKADVCTSSVILQSQRVDIECEKYNYPWLYCNYFYSGYYAGVSS